jgi:hypothetical protein NreA
MGNQHDSHEVILKRLKRALGHLEHVIGMVEQDSPCLKTAQQLQAVISALEGAKTTLAADHVENCILTALEQNNTPSKTKKLVDELKEISKYL